jgi:hypothetical protein
MKRNKPPVTSVKPEPAVFKGSFSASPKWTDVVLADLAYLWRSLFK